VAVFLVERFESLLALAKSDDRSHSTEELGEKLAFRFALYWRSLSSTRAAAHIGDSEMIASSSTLGNGKSASIYRRFGRSEPRSWAELKCLEEGFALSL